MLRYVNRPTEFQTIALDRAQGPASFATLRLIIRQYCELDRSIKQNCSTGFFSSQAFCGIAFEGIQMEYKWLHLRLIAGWLKSASIRPVKSNLKFPAEQQCSHQLSKGLCRMPPQARRIWRPRFTP